MVVFVNFAFSFCVWFNFFVCAAVFHVTLAMFHFALFCSTMYDFLVYPYMINVTGLWYFQLSCDTLVRILTCWPVMRVSTGCGQGVRGGMGTFRRAGWRGRGRSTKYTRRFCTTLAVVHTTHPISRVWAFTGIASMEHCFPGGAFCLISDFSGLFDLGPYYGDVLHPTSSQKAGNHDVIETASS